MTKDTKNIEFIRWGELNPVKHKEARLSEEDKGWHGAPRYKGIYAFPRGFVETFLLGCPCAASKNVKFLLDDSGNKVPSDDFWYWDDMHSIQVNKKYLKLLKKRHIKQSQLTDEYDDRDDKCYIVYNYTKPKTFRHIGEIWCHLDKYIDRHDILEETESWVKVDYNTYCKALQRCSMNERFESYMYYSKNNVAGGVVGDPHTFPAHFAKDHYEVFIEKIKNK